MPVFSGNTTGSILQVAYNIPSTSMSFSLVNKSGGSITVNLYISNGVGTDVSIVPSNLTLDDGDTVYSDSNIRIIAGSSIFITTSGSLDYYISLE